MHWLICLTLVLWVVELAQSYVTKEIEISLPQKSLLEKDVGWYCIAENVDFNQEVYAVSFKGKADYNEIGVMKLFACTTEQSRDSLWACDNPCKGEQGTEIYTWSQDTPPLVLPKNVGFRFGGGEFKHLVLKAELKTTFFEAYSPASISILVTNMHQKFVAGVHRMQINNARGCRSECLYEGVPIIPYAYKTTSGSATKIWRIRGGEKSLLAHSPTQTYKMIDERTVVHKSDILGGSCASDSTQAVKENNCGVYLQYYRVNSALPTTSLTNCFTNNSTTGETSEPLVTSTTKTTTSTTKSTDKKNSTNNKGQKVAVTLSQTDLLESLTVAPTKTSSLTLPPSMHTQQEEPLPRFDTDWYLPSRTLLSLGNVVGVEVTRQHVVLLQQGSRQLTPSLFDKDNKFIGDRTAISENVITVLNKFDGSIERSYGSNMFQFPFGISVDDKLNVWVTDIALHQVIKLSSTGTPIFRLGEQWSPGNDDKHFCQPTDVAVALDSTFYVADGFCNSRVMKVSVDGQLIKTFASSSDNPLSLSLDGHRDELYVAYRHSIDVFRDSQRVRSLKRPLSTASALYWIAYSSVQDGMLYAVNRGSDVIGNTIDSNDGHVLNSWSIQGIGKATGLAVSTNGQAVYVTSEDQRKLLKFHVPDEHFPWKISSTREPSGTTNSYHGNDPAILSGTTDVALMPAIIIVAVLATPVLLVAFISLIQYVRMRGKRRRVVRNRHPLDPYHTTCFSCFATPRYYYSAERSFDRFMGTDPVPRSDDEEEELFITKA